MFFSVRDALDSNLLLYNKKDVYIHVLYNKKDVYIHVPAEYLIYISIKMSGMNLFCVLVVSFICRIIHEIYKTETIHSLYCKVKR